VPATALIGAALRLKLAPRIRRLSDTARWSRHAARIQTTQLRGLLTAAAATEVGKTHAFAKLATLPDDQLHNAYRSTIRTADYEAWREPLARMREDAQPDVTWPGVVRNWAETSGTTGGQKYIPVSDAMMRSNYKTALDIFANAARMGVSLSGLFAGRLLFLGGSTDLTINDRGIRTGDLSGLATAQIRWPISACYSPGLDVALMTHWPSKIDAMAKVALDQDIRAVSGMASWSLVLFERVLEMARDRDPTVRTLRDVWPNLTLFIHGGVRYAPFDRRVREAWSGTPEGDLPHRLEVYPASEGFIAMQDTPGDPGLRLNIDHAIFYEFIPLEDIGRDDPDAFTCNQVEKGQRYVVCMTTCAGLWRYIIGDVVEFDTIPPEGPARLRIVGRHRHFINAFGENLIVEQIEDAVTNAATRVGATLGEFTAAPVYPGQGRRAGLELVVELSNSGIDPTPFRDAFDLALREANVDYHTKRTDGLGMGAPTVSPVPFGSFHRWMESQGKLGGQHKCPRCANHRDYVEGVLACARGETRPAGTTGSHSVTHPA
jgi:hypothetical protein